MSTLPVRPAAFAGRFYPASPKELRGEVERFIRSAPPPTDSGPPLGFVSPHAGYAFSGPCAGHVYRWLSEKPPEIVFVLAPSHHGSFSGASIWDGPAYATPLGECPIDLETVATLRKQGCGFECRRWEEQQEHSLEVQVPFLQVACPEARLVPLLIGQQIRPNIQPLADAIEAALKERTADTFALIASSDAYHGYSIEECRANDERLAADLSAMDVEALYEDSMSRRAMACGLGPIAAAMDVSKRLGARRGAILKQATSADATPRGPQDYVVGYIAAAFSP
ncbi:AmmeMemoRadiSam system protein B [Candidatus Sumerlaeota bacterium]|nr:AmmeMemoRadiSam system protein B [Candidatus Sumerlaeota bacterium]